MSDHAAKFLFLAVVVAAVLFSRAAYPTLTGGAGGGTASSSSATGSGGAADAANQVPLFVLPPIAVSANGANATPVAATATQAAVHPGTQPPPALHDAASLVMDMRSGAVVEAVDPDRRWPTASLAKLMSATIVLDTLATSTAITVTTDMFAVDPEEHNVVVGGRYSVEDLLYLMLLPSSNVAAQANADFYGLGNFLAEMNARATAWGMANTHYDDSSGISAGDETSASDLAKLAQKIYADYPRILQITNTPFYYVTELNSGQKTLIKSINDFAGKPGFIGGKTGYTDQAAGNLLSLFRYDGRPVLVIVLGSSNRFAETQTLYDWFKANFK
jgi:D-alanyl-D-alanine carboxypeptidase